jgi:hypothetical protein
VSAQAFLYGLGGKCDDLVFERDLDQQGGAGDLEIAAERFDSIAEPEQSGPWPGSAPPIPSSRIANRMIAPGVSSSTFTTDACACLAALVNASDTT